MKKIIINGSEVKRLTKSFSDFVLAGVAGQNAIGMLTRPYTPLLRDEYMDIMSMTEKNATDDETDFFKYNGRVCSFGDGGDGYALMPLKYEYAILVNPSQKRTENELTRVAYLKEYSHNALEEIAKQHELDFTDDGSFQTWKTVARFTNGDGEVLATFLMNGYSNGAGAIYRCVGVDASLGVNKKDEY